MKKKRLSVLAVIVFFLMQIIMPSSIDVKAAGSDITGKFAFITAVKITDLDGKDLGDNISKSSEIHINYTWSIPDEEPVNSGDYYTMQLPDQINIAAAIDQPVVNPVDGSIVANMHIDTNGKVTITFTNYPSGHSGVHGAFSLDCHFNQSQIGNVNPVTIDFTIPGLGVIAVGPINFQQPDPTIVKSGVYNSTTDEITWTITVNKEGVRLNNTTVEDIINSGQIFVDNSVTINGYPSVSGVNYTYDNTSRKLLINLENITSQQVITFKTSIHDDLAAKPQGTYNYSNKAVLNYDNNGTTKSITSDVVSIPVTVKYISKDGSYDATNKRINWTIKVNESGRTINNAVVTDIIPTGLTLDTSTVKLNGVAGTSYTISGQNFTYNLGNINSLQTITFSTNIDPKVYNSNNTKSYNNTAVLSGDGVLTGTSSSITVGVSPNIIQKQGAGYDASKGVITWKVIVNNNQTTVAAGAKVTDNIPIGQAYVAGSAKLDGVSIDDSGYTDASNGDSTKTGTFTYTFLSSFSDIHTITFQTKVTNPKVYQANYSGNYNNTVTLTNTDINQSTSAAQLVSSEIINKTGAGYNYATREITWKIVIDKNKMPITNAVITDNISAGQEYVDKSASIDNGAPASGFNYIDVTGDAAKTGTLTYTFPQGKNNTINNTYTITFKTKIIDLSIFNTNGTKTLSNIASITGDEIPLDGNRSSTGTQKVNSTVINKTPKYAYGNAYIDWTLNINSNFNIQMSKASIIDNLQDGLSLNTDTVELYKATVNSNGTLTQGAKVPLTGENVKYDPSTRKFEFTFSEDAGMEPYILKFTTDVVKPGDYSNTVEFKGTSIDQTSSGVQNGVWFASGSAWGTGISGSITIIKVDSKNAANKLSGAVFQIIDQYGNVKATSQPTGTDGAVVFKSLKYDTDYTLKEITPPVGYNLSSEVYAFQVHNISGQKDIIYNYNDTKIKGDIQFTKKGEYGEGLQGAEFTLYENDAVTPVTDANGKNITATSDLNGKVQFSSIEYGTYKIKETKAPEGYLPSPTVISAVFSGDYQNVKVTVTPDSISNSKIRGGIKITKTDISTAAPVQGATIAVYTSDGNPIGNGVEGKTGADGTVEFDNLIYGDYYFIETSAPEGYLLNTDKHPFSIRENGVILQGSLSDKKITGGIKITKTDLSKGTPVEGAEITVYTSYGEQVGSGVEGKTGADGTVEFDNLVYGDYYYIETHAPEGYLLNTDKHPFSIKDNGIILKSSFSDEKIKGTIQVKKKGEDGNYLKNTEFTLFDSDGKVVQKAISDDNGIARFTDIEYGKYSVKETTPPKGYNISDEMLPVQVDGTDSGEIYEAGTVTDTKIRASIQISKLDQDGKPLQGVEFTLYNASGDALQTAVSSKDGIVLFKDLVYGDYSVKETKALEGYTASKDPIEVSIENDGYVYSYEVKNNRIKGTIEIKKTDMNGSILMGAEFTLYDNSGKAISTQVSDNNGIARFEAVDYGSYTIKETKAPKGYTINNVELKVQVTSQKTQSFTVQDQKEFSSLPTTGRFVNEMNLMIAGLFAVLSGLGLIFIRKRKSDISHD